MIFRIPLSAVPVQTLTVSLADQACRIDLRQFETGLAFSLALDNVPVVSNRLALDRTPLVGYGIVGDLAFVDTQGTSDPDYTGLTDRYTLIYDDAA